MEMIRSIPRPLIAKPRRTLVTESQRPPAQDITAERLRELLHYDPETGIFTRRVRTSNRIEVGDIAGSQSGSGYLYINVCGCGYAAHRLAWLYEYGVWPKGQLDHVNRVRTDNRISNLRDVSHKQNHQNRSKASNNTSGHPGVSWYKRDSKWVVQIMHNYRLIHLGYFTDIEDAIAARKAGELKYWGHHRAD